MAQYKVTTEDGTFLVTTEDAPTSSPKSVTPLQRSFLRETVSNIPSSAANLFKGIYQTVRHPIETGKGLFKIGAGGLSKVYPGEAKAPGDIEVEAAFDAFKEMLIQRYGSIKNIQNTIKTDPVGFAADVSASLSGVGGGLKAAGMARTGSTLLKAGQVIEPVRLIGKTAQGAARAAGETASFLGGITTGVGPKAARRIFLNPEVAVPAMRAGDIGPGSLRDILANAEQGLQNIKTKRSTEYQARLERIAGSDKTFDLNPIKKALDENLEKYRVKVDSNGELDFSRSTLSKEGISDVKEIAAKIKDWGSQAGDNTAIGLDTLKRQLDDFYSPSGDARAIVTELRNKTKDTLTKGLPEYAEMTKAYHEASELIRDIKAATGAGSAANTDTILRKLTSVLRNNFEFRDILAKELEGAGATGLRSQIAGNQMKPWLPRGLAQGAAAGGGLIGLKNLDPKWAAALAASSPRIVGEFLGAMGWTKQAIEALAGKIYTPAKAQILTQAGRSGVFNRQSNEKK